MPITSKHESINLNEMSDQVKLDISKTNNIRSSSVLVINVANENEKICRSSSFVCNFKNLNKINEQIPLDTIDIVNNQSYAMKNSNSSNNTSNV